MRVTSVESTELFVGTTEQPRQIVAVELSHTPAGPSVSPSRAPVSPGRPSSRWPTTAPHAPRYPCAPA